MPFPRLTNDLNIIGKLGDDPNSDNGLSAAELKAKFDEGNLAIKDFINTYLLPALEQKTGSSNIGAEVSGWTENTVQTILQKLKDAIQDMSEQTVPDNGVSTAKIQDDAVTTAKIADDTITTDKIADGAVTAAKLDTTGIAVTVEDGSVNADKIAANAVKEAKINNGAVTTLKIADANVTNAKLASVDSGGSNGAVSTDKINNSAVTTAKINNAAVTTDKINNGAVNADKIAANAVSTILTGTLTSAGWSGSAAPYSQTISVTGIFSTDNPIVDVTYSGTYATDSARAEAFVNIYRIVTANGSITAYAIEKPTVDLPIRLLCIRK